MKRPYFNQFDRLLMLVGTLTGDIMLLKLAWMKLIRDIQKEILKIYDHTRQTANTIRNR